MTQPQPHDDRLASPLEPAALLVRIGTGSAIGRFLHGDTTNLSRGAKVVCRSHRGLEAGNVLGSIRMAGDSIVKGVDGRILRRMTPEDELLWGQLCRLSRKAADKCAAWLDARRIETTLLEVEPLLDGKTLYFHFLSAVPPSVQTHLDSLVQVYQLSVASSRFARLLEYGCGPGCGTENAKHGCGSSGGCAICQVAGACSVSKSTLPSNGTP